MEIIKTYVEANYTYIVKNGEDIIGSIAFNNLPPTEYKKVNWLLDTDNVLCVHGLAVLPKFQRDGIATRLMDFAENFAIENKYKSIRLDTYTTNSAAINLYEKRQYKKCGQVFFPKRELPFLCYEKIL